MWILLSLLIVAADATATNDTPWPYADEVFHCNFGSSWDTNYDRWPDGWSRRTGRGYPHFLDINLTDDPTRPERRCLEVELNGGAAAVYSPPVEIRSSQTYLLTVQVRTADLRHDRASVSITMLDAQRRRLDTYTSLPLVETNDWTTLRIGPVASSHPDAQFAVIGLHVDPTTTPDLKGKAWFSDIQLSSLPRLALGSNASLDLHHGLGEVEIRCDISGLSQRDWTAQLVLEDPYGRIVDQQSFSLADAEPDLDVALPFVYPRDATGEEGDEVARVAPLRYGSSVRWQPKIPRVGFYRVRATIEGPRGLVQQREFELAVIEPIEPAPRGEFGWSPPQGAHPLPLPTLAQLLSQVGVHWVKFPMWYDATDPTHTAELMWFTERLRSQGIGTIGLLHRPPPSVRAQFGDSASLSAADMLTTPLEVWYPSLETVLLRTSLSVRRWQLGTDLDTSLVGFHGLENRVAHLKSKLDQVGHDVQLGFGWNWLHERPSNRVPWRFQTMSANPPLTDRELTAYLSLPRSEIANGMWRSRHSPAISTTRRRVRPTWCGVC